MCLKIWYCTLNSNGLSSFSPYPIPLPAVCPISAGQIHILHGQRTMFRDVSSSTYLNPPYPIPYPPSLSSPFIDDFPSYKPPFMRDFPGFPQWKWEPRSSGYGGWFLRFDEFHRSAVIVTSWPSWHRLTCGVCGVVQQGVAAEKGHNWHKPGEVHMSCVLFSLSSKRQ